MPSRVRQWFEWAARLGLLTGIALLLWRATQPADARSAVVADSRSLVSALERYSVDDRSTSLHVRGAARAGQMERDWLVALRRLGATVTWDSEGLPAVAVAQEALADPVASTRIMLAAGVGTRLVVGDALVNDTVVATSTGGTSLVLGSIDTVSIGVSTSSRVVALPPTATPPLRRVLVVGSAGWETRFTLVALEERGWTTSVRMAVSPGVVVQQGDGDRLDTARFAAVVAVDQSAAARASEIARFVSTGGGLVILPDAAMVLRGLAAGISGPVSAGDADRLTTDSARLALAVRPLERLVPGSVPIERRGRLVTVAGRRYGLGRVLQVGYEDLWRWRLASKQGPDAHRLWWTRAVGSVAFTGLAVPVPLTDPGLAAPVAAMASALGPPTRAPLSTHSSSPTLPPWTLGLLLVIALLEWASRRFRGLQ